MPTPAEPGVQTAPGLIVFRFGADLFYANADRFADNARALVDGAPTRVEWFVLDASAITDIDYSAAGIVRELLADFASRRINVAFGRVAPPLRADLERHGVAAALRENRIFASLHEALAMIRAETGKA